MTVIEPDMTSEELAALVCSTLERHGIEVVLSGGAVVTIYSNNAYQSADLDFIMTGIARRTDAAMLELGFHKEGRYWKHPDTPYWVEFPPGPVEVGSIVVSEFAERRTRFGVLRLLAPTECVMDRLAAFYHFKDPQGLDQAVAVAVACRRQVDMRKIQTWSKKERAAEKWDEFSRRVQEAGGSKPGSPRRKRKKA